MEKPTIAIGDVHGLDLWRDVVEAHPECRVVFLGDYLDPFFYMSKVRLLENLREIIDFKRSRPEDSVLLMGNHDLHYFCGEASPASRFDAGIAGEASSSWIIWTCSSMLFRMGSICSLMPGCRSCGSITISAVMLLGLWRNS